MFRLATNYFPVPPLGSIISADGEVGPDYSDLNSNGYDILEFSTTLQNLEPGYIQYRNVVPAHIRFPLEGDITMTVLVFGVSDFAQPNRQLFARWNSLSQGFENFDPNNVAAPISYSVSQPAFRSPTTLTFTRHVYDNDTVMIGINPLQYLNTPNATLRPSTVSISFVVLGNVPSGVLSLLANTPHAADCRHDLIYPK